MANVGSLRLTGECFFQSNATPILTNRTAWTVSFWVKYNTIAPGVFCELLATTFDPLAQISTGGQPQYLLWGDGSSNPQTYGQPFSPGVVYMVVQTWAAPTGTWHIYVNGNDVDHNATGATPWTSNQLIGFGPQYDFPSSFVGGDIQISNLAIWSNYQATAADVLALRNAVYDPSTLIGSISGVPQPASSWWTFGDASSGAVTQADSSFTDQIGTLALPNLGGSLSNAAYAPPLVYAPPCAVSMYVSKSGREVIGMALCNQTTTAPVSGTVSVNSGSASLSSSAPQAAWVGKQLQITGDSSATTYTIDGGYGREWALAPAYGGSSNAVSAGATLITAFPTSVITAITSQPTFSVQFGGTGPAHVVTTGLGPIWTATLQQMPFAAWDLLCGPVASILVQTPGHNYSASPSASASGGGGSGLALGAPVTTGGVTSYAVTGGGGGYGVPPLVVVAPSAITFTGTFTSGSTSVTGVSSTAGLLVGMSLMGAGIPNAPNHIAAIGSGTITLYDPATVSGSHSVTAQGKQPMATCVLTGGVVTAINVFVPGTGYILGSPPSVTIVTAPSDFNSWQGFGSQTATATCTVSRVIASIPVTSPGSDYTSPPTITITDGTGSGAVAAPVMGGVQPSDVVTYTAADSWLTAAVGVAPAAPSQYATGAVANYSGQLEPGFGGFFGFNLPANRRTMPVGWNVPAMVGNTYYGTYDFVANWFKRASFVTNVATAAIDQRPLTITGTSGTPTSWSLDAMQADNVDSLTGYAVAQTGVFTLIADDTDAASPTNFSITSFFGAGTVTSSSIGGAPTVEGTATTGLTSITLTAGGSGFTDYPTVTISGNGTGASAYALIGNGAVVAIYLLATGSGYTGSVTITISGGGGTGATATATIGNVLVGRLWQWTCTRNGLFENLYWTVNAWKTVGGTYAYTATNECLISPQGTAAALPALPSRATGMGPDAGITAWLTTKTPKYPYVIRCIDGLCGSDGAGNNIVDPEDLKSPYLWTNYSPAGLSGAALTAHPTGTRQISIASIRTYALTSSGYPSGWNVTWSSPNVYLPQAYTGTTATAGWSGYGPGSLGGPFHTSPTTQKFLTLIPGAPNGLVVGEMVTSTPHNLKAGQQIIWSNNTTATGTFSHSLSATTTATGQSFSIAPILVFPTSATTFCFIWFPNTATTDFSPALPGGINNIAGNFAVDYVFSVIVPDGAGFQGLISYEQYSQMVGSYPGCNIWVTVPHAATDVCISAIAQRVRDNFPKGRKVYVEYCNETWSLTLQRYYCASMNNLGAIAGTNPDECAVTRASEAHALFITTFNSTDINGNTNRGGEIVRLFGSQYGNPGLTDDITSFAETATIQIDAICVANYVDLPGDNSDGSLADEPSIDAAGSSLATHWPTSARYQQPPWTRAMLLDLYRHTITYSSANVSVMTSHQQALNGYSVATGHPVPLILGYEGGLQSALPSGVGAAADDPMGFTLFEQLVHDVFYDPDIHNVEDAFNWSSQQWGLTAETSFILVGPLNGRFDPIWTHATQAGQPAGKGDGTLASDGTNRVNRYWADDQLAHNDVNTAIRVGAWQDWADQANPGSANALNGAGGNDTFSGAALAESVGTLAGTGAGDRFAASGVCLGVGTLSGAGAPDVFAGIAHDPVIGSLAASGGDDLWNGSSQSTVPAPSPGARERDVRNAMRGLLLATNAFDPEGVWLFSPSDQGEGTDVTAGAWIEPMSSTITDQWDAQPSAGLNVTALVKVTMAYRNSDPQARDEGAELLFNRAADALDGQVLVAGFNVPGLTRFTSWTWVPPTAPERQIVAIFQFGYEIEGWDNFDLTP